MPAIQLLLPISLSFAFDVVAGVFEVFVDFAGVLFVADFEEHLDADSAERCEPHGSAVENLNDVGAGFGDRV